MSAEHRAQIQAVVQGVAASAIAYDEGGRSSMPIELDHVASLMAASHDFALFDARIERVLAILDPIIETGKGHMGTHSDHCHVYHAGCLAVRVRDSLTGALATPDLPTTESEL